MPNQTVSLIMTVYNREAYLGLAIESVLVQTFADFELIIWDDGSTDRSVEIARHYAQHDTRIKLFEARHRGRIGALKLAHEQAKGKYVGWIDSDDVLAQTALTETTTVLTRESKVGMVYTNYWVMNEVNQMQGLGRMCQIPYSKARLLVEFMTFHFRLIRRSLYEQVGGVDESFPYAMDYDLCLKLSEVGEVQHLAEPLYYYRYHAVSISQAQRLGQIECSWRAVENALRRRGMAEQYELDVKIHSVFRLKPKRLSRQSLQQALPSVLDTRSALVL